MKTFITVVIFFSINYAFGQDKNVWPQFRGINCSGIAEQNQEPPTFFEKEKNLLWSCELSDGYSSPCIWNNHIFLTGYDEEDKSLKMYSINRLNGKMNWEKEIIVQEFGKRNAVSNPANATPTTDGHSVVFYFDCYGLLCYDFQGELMWEMILPFPKTRHGMGTSPVIYNNMVFLNCFGNADDPCVFAIDKKNGEIIWKHTKPGIKKERYDSYATPIIYEDNVIIYGYNDISAINIKDGGQEWSFPNGTGEASCTPVIGSNLLYFTVYSTQGNPEALEQFPGYQTLFSIYDKNGDKLLTKEETKDFSFYMYPEKKDIDRIYTMAGTFRIWDHNKDNFVDSTEYVSQMKTFESAFQYQGIKALKIDQKDNLDLTDLVWSYPDNVPQVSSPLYYDGLIYMVRSGGTLSCLDAEKGTLYYREKLGAPGTYFSSPIVANGMIYFISRNGVNTVIEAGKKLKIVSKNDLDEISGATPAIVDNKIYIRTTENLYAFGE